ncbi:MAG: GNAT family N-acetyltransferase [Desulfosalsimonas sp.]
MQNVDVRRAEDEDKELWDNYVTSHQNTVAYHLFAWKQSVEEAYGFDCPYFVAEKQGKVCGILPLVHVAAPLGRGQLVSLPFCDVGGIPADSPGISESLFSHACNYAAVNRVSKIEIRHFPNIVFSDTDRNRKKDHKSSSKAPGRDISGNGKVRMLLDLPESSDALLVSFKSKLRSQVKKPAREGLFVRIGGRELLPDFYHVFAENMRELGSPVHSKKWLDSILRNYGSQAKCGMVYLPDQRPAAGGIILCHNRIVSIPWASSMPHLNHYSPNMLLYWSFLEYAADNGYQYFDFGRSTPGEGTYKFKAQWGAKPQQLFWERWKINGKTVSEDTMGAVSNANGKSRAVAEKMIRKTPLPVATFLGSRIRKYISL